MALGKLLELGGIDNSPPKAKQETGKFRVARNVYPTPDNRLIPRYHNSESDLSNLDKKCYHHISKFDDKVISLVSEYSIFSGNYVYALYRDNEKIPRSSDISASPFSTRTEDYPQQVQCQRISNTAYYLSPYDSTLFKYDGIEVSYAGVHQPVFSCAQASNNTTGIKYVRVIQNRFDFEGNVDYSEDIMFKVLTSTNSIQIRVDGGATNILTYPSSLAVSPYPITGLGIVTPKIANDIYFKCSQINYVSSFGTSAVPGQIYVNLTNNKAYIGEGSSYTLVYEGSRLIYPNLSSFPTIGEYQTLYVDSSNNKIYRWAVAERQGLAYDNLASFPAVGDGTKYYCAKDTGLIYKWTGAYVLFPNAGEYIEVVNGSFTISAHYQFSSNDYTILSFDTNITQQNIGSYIAIGGDFQNSIISSFIGIPGDTQEIGLATYKIKDVIELVSVTGKVKLITLDALDIKYSNDVRTGFKTVNTDRYISGFLSEPVERDKNFSMGSRTFFSIWGSLNNQGDFFQKRFCFSFPSSTIKELVTLDVTSATMTSTNIRNAVVTAQILGDVYDVENPPISLNENVPELYGINSGIYCMTSYSGALYFASDSYLFISNSYLPKNLGMINQNGIYLIGDFEDGRYTSICGTNEFLMVSRERKNYYVTGNVFTGNFRIQNITEAEVGAWGNCTSISIKDSVIFLTSKGVYQTIEGGKTSLMSSKCPKNFSTFDSVNVNEDVSFKITGLVSNNTLTSEDNSIVLAYDEYRDLLVFMQKTDNNSCLVLSMKTGQFYEWDGLLKSYPNQYANCINFIESEYYLGGISTEDDTAKIVKEDKEISLDYVYENPVKLYTTWLTAGEPSLEKLLLQLKIFGRIQSNGNSNSISICHYKDWDLSTKVTNSQYFPRNVTLSLNDQTQYSHKKRLNSDKVLSASVGIEINYASVNFEIESMEVELNAIQEGMKR